MNAESRETVGYICRWGVLAVAGATALGAAAACVRATTAIHADLHAVLIVPDTVWVAEQGRQMNLVGYSLPGTPVRSVHTFVSWPGRGVRFMPSHGRHLFLRVGSPGEGVHELTAHGVPHGRFALQGGRARFHVLPVGRDVCMVDARTVRRALAAGDEMLKPVLDLLWARGDVVFVHPGPVEHYPDVRDALRRVAPRAPVVCAVDTREPDDRMETLWITWDHLRRMDRKPMLLTDDAALAVSTSGAGQPTHLVSAEAVPGPPNAPLHCHASLAKVKEYLAAEPISDTTER